MKLSEAILLGSTLRPQTRGYLFADGRSCALGAAGEAIGAEPKDCPSLLEVIRNEWPWTQVLSFRCPACWRPKGTLKALRLITHLNDFHNWTRQCTAAWIASVEPAEQEGRIEVVGDDASAHTKKITVCAGKKRRGTDGEKEGE